MSCKPPALNNMAQRFSCDTGTLMQIINLRIDFSQRGSQVNLLQAAVMIGNYRICKQLLVEGAGMLTLSNVPPPLCLALDLDRYQIARLLIDSGANVLLPHQGMYPMYYALKPNTPQFIVEAIIKAGFLPDSIIEDRHCNTALHKAVVCKNVDVVKALIKLNADCNLKETQGGCTPLHIAVNSKVPLIAQILINSGADLEAEDKGGLTPLFHAVYQNDIIFVNFLIELGANIHHLCSETLVYPLNVAANLGHKAITEALLKQGADPSRVAPGMASLPIHSVAMSRNGKTAECAEQLKGIVELLISQGSEVDVPNKDGNTPVQLALREHNFTIVEVLIQQGAAVNHNLDQGTTLHYIAKVANEELVNMCFEYGADYSIPDSSGKTPYHLAMFNHDLNVLNIFWKFGCPFDLPANGPTCGPLDVFTKLDGQKKLMLGIKENNVNMMKSALSNGAEVRSCSMEIPYPLHFAVSNGFSSVVLLLLEKGTPSNIINNKGESPLHIAASRGYSQICRYLLRYGACYNLPTNLAGKSPLDLALENNQYEIVYILREIDLMFKSSINKSFEGLQGIFEKSNSVQSLQAYLNSINKDGSTLLAVALKEKNFDLAENLMKLRLQIIKA